MAERLWRNETEKQRDFAYFEALEVEAMKASASRRTDAATIPGPLPPEVLRDIIAIARERAALVMRMKEALLDGNDAEALKLAREVCGMEAE